MGTEQRKKYLKSMTGREANLRGGLQIVNSRIGFLKKIIKLYLGNYESEAWRHYKQECTYYKAIKGAIKKQIPAKPVSFIVDDFSCYMSFECVCGCRMDVSGDSMRNVKYCPVCGQRQNLTFKHWHVAAKAVVKAAEKIIKRNDDRCFIWKE